MPSIAIILYNSVGGRLIASTIAGAMVNILEFKRIPEALPSLIIFSQPNFGYHLFCGKFFSSVNKLK